MPALTAPQSPPGANPVDLRPPISQLVMFGIQHVLIMYAGCVSVPLIFGAGESSRTQFKLFSAAASPSLPSLHSH